MQIVFRTDSSSRIGIGHLVRSLVLADELKRHGHRCIFVCRDLTGHQGKIAKKHGHRLALLPVLGGPTDSSDLKEHLDQDVEETCVILAEEKPDWLVCDHYGIDEQWESSLRGKTKHILVIDDMADRRHDCDVLIDQNLFPDINERYNGWVNLGTLLLGGPEYALLRSEFAATRAKMERTFGLHPRLFVCFGGADPANATERVVSVLLATFGESLPLEVVAGPSNPHFNRLRILCENKKNIRLHRQVDHIADCLAGTDLAIGGGGVSALERCALGVPSLIYAIAGNQISPSQSLAAAGAVRYLGIIEKLDAETLATSVAQLVTDAHARAVLSRIGMKLVDGLGASRVVDILLKQQ